MFPKTDPVTGKKITKDDISKLDYSYQIKKLSSYSYRRIKYNTLKVRKHSDNYEIGYYYQACCPASVVFKMPYKIKDNKLIFYYPKNYIYKGEKAPVTGIQTYPFDGIKNVINDFNNFIYPRLDKMALYTNTYVLKGEKNIPYNLSSIYANFEKLLGKYNYWNDKKVSTLNIKTENTFALKIKGKVYPVEVTVYPYKNGSKVMYKAYFNYTVISGGKSTLTKSDIEKAKQKIEQIIED